MNTFASQRAWLYDQIGFWNQSDQEAAINAFLASLKGRHSGGAGAALIGYVYDIRDRASYGSQKPKRIQKRKAISRRQRPEA